MFMSKRFRWRCALLASKKPSIETPHDSLHGALGDVMGGFRSSFSPLFWLHHNNVDRFYEAYISYETDSASEFRRHQRSLTRRGRTRPTPGFPDGPWGEYFPFVHPTSGRRFHARDCFDTAALGYVFDDLPTSAKWVRTAVDPRRRTVGQNAPTRAR